MKPEIKKLLILNLPYLLFVWLFDKVGAAVRLSPGADASAKLLHLGDGFTAAFSSIAPSFHPADLALGIAGAVIVRLIIYTKGKNAKKYRRGTEYGSARWGGADDIKPYTDPVFENNIPLTQTERLTMNSRPKQPKYARNKNILVIGGSGSGKTRFFVKPSLMQCTSKDFPTSYIVTDPKGTLILETGKMLQRYKYRIKVLNTINFKKSMKYNPFAYLRSEKDILKLVNTIIANTKGDGEKSGEDFWVKAEKLYYTALIGYIWYEAPEDALLTLCSHFICIFFFLKILCDRIHIVKFDMSHIIFLFGKFLDLLISIHDHGKCWCLYSSNFQILVIQNRKKTARIDSHQPVSLCPAKS